MNDGSIPFTSHRLLKRFRTFVRVMKCIEQRDRPLCLVIVETFEKHLRSCPSCRSREAGQTSPNSGSLELLLITDSVLDRFEAATIRLQCAASCQRNNEIHLRHKVDMIASLGCGR